MFRLQQNNKIAIFLGVQCEWNQVLRKHKIDYSNKIWQQYYYNSQPIVAVVVDDVVVVDDGSPIFPAKRQISRPNAAYQYKP